MRLGGFLHQRLILRPIETLCQSKHAAIRREHPVQVDSRLCFLDLTVSFGSWLVAIEAETGVRRLRSDIEKAVAIKADLLLIVVANWRIAEASRKRLVKLYGRVPLSDNLLPVLVLPVGPALQCITDLSDFVRRSLPSLSYPITELIPSRQRILIRRSEINL